jgi:hypothetical protein
MWMMIYIEGNLPMAWCEHRSDEAKLLKLTHHLKKKRNHFITAQSELKVTPDSPLLGIAWSSSTAA